jgi:hypothetical protein
MSCCPQQHRHRSTGSLPMEAILLTLVVAVVILGLVAFDLLAVRYGVDTRAGIGDDHARHARPLGIR